MRLYVACVRKELADKTLDMLCEHFRQGLTIGIGIGFGMIGGIYK